MACFPIATINVLFIFGIMWGIASAQLSPTFYSTSCPNISSVVLGVVTQARQNDARIGPKLLRVFFHDCMVNGCDGSLLLDGTGTEKTAIPNQTTEGFEVVDDIKTALESVCPGVVSCSDILALSVQLLLSLDGGPTWTMPLGRRDGLTPNAAGTTAIPSPFDNITVNTQKFDDVNLDVTDLVALSGAHSFGRARCGTFSFRLNNFNGTTSSDPTIDTTYLATLRQNCPDSSADGNLNNFDPVTPDTFDNNYYTNLQNHQGLLQTDQELFSTAGPTVAVVNQFAGSQTAFFDTFVTSMIKLGNVNVLTGTSGQIRSNCRSAN